MGLFGKSGSSSSNSRSPRDQVREWSSKLRKQTYVLDRQIRGIQREEQKVKQSLKQAAKKGDREVCVILAKEIVRSRKAVNRITTTKAQLNSVGLHMQQQAATLRVAGAMQVSIGPFILFAFFYFFLTPFLFLPFIYSEKQRCHASYGQTCSSARNLRNDEGTFKGNDTSGYN